MCDEKLYSSFVFFVVIAIAIVFKGNIIKWLLIKARNNKAKRATAIIRLKEFDFQNGRPLAN